MMMRVIAHPSMLKDGSTMGGFAGATAALLAAEGFSGAPAETIELFDADPGLWRDLGTRWRIMEQYVKPMPVCRWAQPAAQAVLALRAAHPRLDAAQVRGIAVRSFHEAVSLDCREPAGTDAAQYSLPFAVAATLVHGRLTAAEIDGAALRDPAVLALSRTARLIEAPDYSARFPAERWADVAVTLADGTVLESGPTTTQGDPERPLDDAALIAKFRAGSAVAWDDDAAAAIAALVMEGSGGTAALRDRVLAAPRGARRERRKRPARASPGAASSALDRRAVQAGHRRDQREAEAAARRGAAALQAVEAVEDLRALGRRDARSVVVDGQHGPPAAASTRSRRSPGGVWRSAFSTRLTIIWVSSSRSPGRRSRRAVEAQRWPASSAAGAKSSTTARASADRSTGRKAARRAPASTWAMRSRAAKVSRMASTSSSAPAIAARGLGAGLAVRARFQPLAQPRRAACAGRGRCRWRPAAGSPSGARCGRASG